MMLEVKYHIVKRKVSSHLMISLPALYPFALLRSCINWGVLGVVIHSASVILLNLHLPSLTLSVQFQTHYLSYSLQHYLAASQALCWSKQGRIENDENADSDDDKDGYCDIPKVFWCKLIKSYLFPAQYRAICHQARTVVIIPSACLPHQSSPYHVSGSISAHLF